MKKTVTLPNILSMLRIFMIPIIIFLMIHVSPQIFPYLIVVYVFAVFLDFLDGFIARCFSQESDLGKIIDPLADKFLVLSLLFTLTIKFDFPVWLAVFIVLRDILILWASFLLFKGRKIIKPSLVIGKFTFGLLSLLIFVFIVDLSDSIDLFLLKRFFIVLSSAFLLWSWCEYSLVYLREKNGRK
ncbi:CDP-alcohol phosphatidyltransferase family protein [candidate division KSB1 bacterium]|nr:MAG: CDP-alcohol phosphatidyltransferase family protein [candidate division KSB1 bacterium]